MSIGRTAFSAAQRNIIYIVSILSVCLSLLLRYLITKFSLHIFLPVPMLDYICICLFLPVCIFILIYFLKCYCIFCIGERYLADCLGMGCFFFFLFLVFFHIDWSIYYKWAPWNHKIYKNLFTHFFSLLICPVIFITVWKARDIKLRYWFGLGSIAGVLFLSGYMASFAVLNDWHIYNQNSLNFGVVLYPIVQCALGKAVLIDLHSQYGLYPQFLEPLIRITGLSILSVSCILAFLLFISLFMTGIALLNVVKNKILAVLGFAAFLFFHLFSASLWPYELYFQYYPIRTLFPAISFLAATYYFRRPSKKAYLSILCILSIGILWNVDVGAVAFLSFVLSNVSLQLSRCRRTFGEKMQLLFLRGLESLSPVVLVFTLYAVYLRIRYHFWPDFFRLLLPHGYFLRQYSQLTLNKSWVLAALLYIVCLVYSIREIQRKRVDYFNSILLFLSILGIGLFSYHANQYFDQVLTACAYPALLLLVVCTDKGLLYLRCRRKTMYVSDILFLICSCFFISFCAISFLCSLHGSPPIRKAVRIEDFYPMSPENQKVLWEDKTPFSENSENSVRYVKVKDIACGNPDKLSPPWKQRASLLKDFFAARDIRDKKLVIFSMWDAWLYMELHKPSALNIVNSVHLYVSKKWGEVAKRLRERDI